MPAYSSTTIGDIGGSDEVAVRNMHADAIPPYAVMEIIGVDPDSGAYKVTMPRSDNLSAVLFNGASTIPGADVGHGQEATGNAEGDKGLDDSGDAGDTDSGGGVSSATKPSRDFAKQFSLGSGRLSFPCVAAIDGDSDFGKLPKVGDEMGTVADSWFLRQGRLGFVCAGGAYAGFCNIAPADRGLMRFRLLEDLFEADCADAVLVFKHKDVCQYVDGQRIKVYDSIGQGCSGGESGSNLSGSGDECGCSGSGDDSDAPLIGKEGEWGWATWKSDAGRYEVVVVRRCPEEAGSGSGEEAGIEGEGGGSEAAGSGCITSIGGLNLADIPEGTPTIFFGLDANGCLVKIGGAQCPVSGSGA